MQGFISYLKIFYFIEIFGGLVASPFMAMLLATMAMDSPTASPFNYVFGMFFGFLIVFIPTVVIPWLAIKELEKYESNKKLLFNIINSIMALFSYALPFALLNFYIFYRLRSSENITKDSTAL